MNQGEFIDYQFILFRSKYFGDLVNGNEIYEYIDDKFRVYYQSQGIQEYDNKFLNFIIDNGLENEPLEDNLSSIDDCVVLDFDDDFPINTEVDKYEFIIKFLRKMS